MASSRLWVQTPVSHISIHLYVYLSIYMYIYVLSMHYTYVKLILIIHQKLNVMINLNLLTFQVFLTHNCAFYFVKDLWTLGQLVGSKKSLLRGRQCQVHVLILRCPHVLASVFLRYSHMEQCGKRKNMNIIRYNECPEMKLLSLQFLYKFCQI
jgi:hypothetical protein